MSVYIYNLSLVNILQYVLLSGSVNIYLSNLLILQFMFRTFQAIQPIQKSVYFGKTGVPYITHTSI